ncbi:MAG: hypothetical protein C4326_12500 [Ignavibacteria bacterium]
MAKRHASLVSLSHDHHHGLALALRLRQGDQALLNDGWTHDRDEQARRVQQFYENELRHHFRAEEEALFPALETRSLRSAPIVATLRKQHRELEQRIAALAQAHGDQLEHALVALGALLEQHIRIEERELFEIYQSDLNEEQKNAVGEAIRRSVAFRK